jgi:DNA-binding NarL/FixJ family response regulator
MLADALRRTPLSPTVARVRALAVTSQSWLADVLHKHSAGEIGVIETPSWAECLELLRDTHFDVLVLVQPNGSPAELVEALEGGGHELPVVILGAEASGDAEVAAYAAGAAAYCALPTATAESLAQLLDRTVQHAQLAREHRQLTFAERLRTEHEHSEAERLLAEQRSLVHELESLADLEVGLASDSRSGVSISTADELPAHISTHYAELLQAYVVMGSGSMVSDVQRLAEQLAAAGCSAHRAMQLHLAALEELVHTLGSRSARHVLNRADLLVLEVMVWLAECYRGR